MIQAREALQVLLELTRTLAQDRPLEESLVTITSAALQVLPGEHASIRLLDDEGEEVIAGARSGTGADGKPPTFRRGEGLIGWVVEHGEVLRLTGARNDPRYEKAINPGFYIESILAVPLWASGKVVGVLSVSSSKPEAFGEDDEVMARLLANCTIPALENARLNRLMLTDELTLAYNRRYFGVRVRAEMERARYSRAPLSILFFDLDLFKQVNDDFGHDVGDMVLREFADRVRIGVRRYDVLIRRGGEEFILVMPATTGADARAVAEQIRLRLESSPLQVGEGRLIAQTVSIGVAEWDGVESERELEHRADQAMYEAKRAGRNRVVLAPAQER